MINLFSMASSIEAGMIAISLLFGMLFFAFLVFISFFRNIVGCALISVILVSFVYLTSSTVVQETILDQKKSLIHEEIQITNSFDNHDNTCTQSDFIDLKGDKLSLFASKNQNEKELITYDIEDAKVEFKFKEVATATVKLYKQKMENPKMQKYVDAHPELKEELDEIVKFEFTLPANCK